LNATAQAEAVACAQAEAVACGSDLQWVHYSSRGGGGQSSRQVASAIPPKIEGEIETYVPICCLFHVTLSAWAPAWNHSGHAALVTSPQRVSSTSQHLKSLLPACCGGEEVPSSLWLWTVNFHKAPTSRIPCHWRTWYSLSLAHMAGGGILPSSRQHRRHLVLGFRVPTVKLVAHAANWRGSPVFPPAISAGILQLRQSSVFFCVISVPLCW